MTQKHPEREETSAERPLSVADAILTAFFDEMDRSEDLAESSRVLRKLVLEDRVFNEPAVRAALFELLPVLRTPS